jgi:histidinol-phosphatase (PHP family)
MFASYHNHSHWSDGTASIREMALAAKASGIAEFGISDHLVLHPDPFGEQRFWSMAPAQIAAYVAEAEAVRAELQDDGFQMRIGVEADFFPSTVEALRALLARFPFDYVIGAAHYALGFPVDHDARDWRRLAPEERGRIWPAYLDKLAALVRAGCCDFLAHLDLPKKFGWPMPEALRPKMEALLDAIAETGLPIELNTAGLDKTIREWYPAEWILRRAADLGIPVMLSADAHGTAEVARHFAEARQTLAALGIRTCRFHRRQRETIAAPPR